MRACMRAYVRITRPTEPSPNRACVNAVRLGLKLATTGGGGDNAMSNALSRALRLPKCACDFRAYLS